MLYPVNVLLAQLCLYLMQYTYIYTVFALYFEVMSSFLHALITVKTKIELYFFTQYSRVDLYATFPRRI
jgi:hypothetical protein